MAAAIASNILDGSTSSNIGDGFKDDEGNVRRGQIVQRTRARHEPGQGHVVERLGAHPVPDGRQRRAVPDHE